MSRVRPATTVDDGVRGDDGAHVDGDHDEHGRDDAEHDRDRELLDR